MTSGSVKADSPLPAEKDPCLRPRQRSWPPLSIPPLFLLSTPAPRQSVGRPRHVRPVGTPVPRPHVKGTVCVTVLFVKIHFVTWSESGFKTLQTLTAFVVQCRVQSSWASCRSLSLSLLLSLSLAGSLPCDVLAHSLFKTEHQHLLAARQPRSAPADLTRHLQKTSRYNDA